MSYSDGWAALNLEMPGRVPRTEYSASTHWELVGRVTGIGVDAFSSEEVKAKAEQAFVKAWNYDFIWQILIHNQVFEGKCSTMGHAEYASGGVDYSNELRQLYKDPEDALDFDPWELYGKKENSQLVQAFNEDYRQQCLRFPNALNMTGIYVTLMSGLIEIFGWDTLLMAAAIDEKAFGEVVDRYAGWMQQYFNALADSEAPAVMVHDDIVWTEGAFLKPEWYRKHIFPNYKKYFSPLKESGKKIIFTSDGNYSEFIDDIADCGIHAFVMEPTTDMKYIAEKYGRTHAFIGNADTRILLSGTRDDIRAEVKRCMDIGKNCPGFFMAVGNHIPSNTPVENALYYNEVYEELSRR